MTKRVYGLPLPVGVTLCDEYSRDIPFHANGFPDAFSLEWGPKFSYNDVGDRVIQSGAPNVLTVITRVLDQRDPNNERVRALNPAPIHMQIKISNVMGNVPMSNIFSGDPTSHEPYLLDKRELQVYGYMFGKFDLTPKFLSEEFTQEASSGGFHIDTYTDFLLRETVRQEVLPAVLRIAESEMRAERTSYYTNLGLSGIALANAVNTDVSLLLLNMQTDPKNKTVNQAVDARVAEYETNHKIVFDKAPFPYMGVVSRDMIGKEVDAYYPRMLTTPNITYMNSAIGTISQGAFNCAVQKHLGNQITSDQGELPVTSGLTIPDRYPSIIRSVLVSYFFKKVPTKISIPPNLYKKMNDIIVCLHEAIDVIFEQTIDKFLALSSYHNLDISSYASIWAAYVASLENSLSNALLGLPIISTAIGNRANQIDIDLMAAYRNAVEIQEMVDEFVSIRFEPKMNVLSRGFLLNELKEFVEYLYGTDGLNHSITTHEAHVVSEELCGIVGGSVNLAIIVGAMDSGLRRSSCGLYLRFAKPEFYMN